MLVAYFDESRKHDKTSGRDVQVVVGGAIAHAEQWLALSKKWESILSAEGLNSFHMSEFESRKGKYDKWCNRENERQAFLNKLLDIISQHILCIIGTRVPVNNNGRFADTYVEAVRRTIVNATQDVAHSSKEKISLVFAMQPEISYKRIITYCDKLKRLAIPNLDSCTGADPKSTLPLQVADLLSYEIMKWDGGWNPITWRYPLRRLRSGTVTFHVLQV